MANEVLQAAVDRGNVLTTEIEAVADRDYSDLGTTVLANQTNLDRFFFALLTIDFVSSPNNFGAVELYAVPSPDGTNYVDAGSTIRPAPALRCGTFLLLNTGSPQLLVTSTFALLPLKYKFMIRNRSGQPIPTGAQVKIYSFGRAA